MKPVKMLKARAENLKIGRLVFDRGDNLVGAVSTIDRGGAFTVVMLGGYARKPGWMEGWNVDGLTGISTFTIFDIARRLGMRPRCRGFWLSMRVVMGYRLSARYCLMSSLPVEYTAERLDSEWMECVPVLETEPRWRGIRAAARAALSAIDQHVKCKPHKRSRVVRIVFPNRSKK